MWIYLLLAYKANVTYLLPAYTSYERCQKVAKIVNKDNYYDRTSCEEIWVIKRCHKRS